MTTSEQGRDKRLIGFWLALLFLGAMAAIVAQVLARSAGL